MKPLTNARRSALTVLAQGRARRAHQTEIVRNGQAVNRYVHKDAAEWLITNGYAEPVGHQIRITELGEQRLADETAGIIR